MRKLAYVAVMVSLGALCACANVKVVRPQVEMQDNPVGLGNTEPRFSWQIESRERGVVQTAYQIVVSETEKGARNGGERVVWDSGKVPGNASLGVRYAGLPLESGKEYRWRVQVWTNKGEAKSVVQMWSMGLLRKSDWRAKWIGLNDRENISYDSTRVIFPARYLRKEFNAGKGMRRAMLYCSAGGSMVWYVNGRRVGNDVLAPLDSWFPESINALAYDVTSLLRPGKANAIGCLLGNGRFMGLRHEDRLHFGMPCAIAQLVIENADGTTTVLTDETWKVNNRGPVRNNNEFDGETYDARLELGRWTEPNYVENADWHPVEVMPEPTKELLPQMSPSQIINEEIHAKKIWKDGNGNYVVDMGQNFVGWTRMRVRCRKDVPVSVHYAESLMPDGKEIYDANMRLAQTIDTYIPARDGQVTWEPQLVYHGGRYLEVKGLDYEPSLSDFTGCVIHDRMERTGHFFTSNEVLNKIHEAAYWGVRGNYHGMPTDCPQRDEKQGWLGDHATGCYGESFLLSNQLLYTKWMRDIEESQSPEGAISSVVPRLWTLWFEEVLWPSAYPYGVDMLYTRYGDDYSILRRYDSLRKWVLWVKNTFYENGIVLKDTYGDWCVPPESPEMIHSEDPTRKTDGQLLGTSVFYDALRVMIKFARVCGKTDDVSEYEVMRREIYDAFNAKFFDKEHGYYGNNTVTANILALDLGLVPENEKQRVMKNIEDVTNNDQNKGHISCGVLGVQHLMRGLTHNGNVNLAYRIATNETYPSWGYMLSKGATTIWELWNGDTADPAMNSGNHVMLLGDLVIWMYEDLGGIRNDEGSVGYEKILFKPYFPDGLDHVDASWDSPCGRIESHWKITNGKLRYEVVVPANTTARIVVPAKYGLKASVGDGVTGVETRDGETVIRLGSGRYTFM